MFEAADIREWRGHEVVDPDGHKIGELGATHVDTEQATSQRSALSKNGLRTGDARVVPLAVGIGGPGHTRSPTIGSKPGTPFDHYEGGTPGADEEAIFKMTACLRQGRAVKGLPAAEQDNERRIE